MIDCTFVRPQNDTKRAAVAVTAPAKPRMSPVDSPVWSMAAAVVGDDDGAGV